MLLPHAGRDGSRWVGRQHWDKKTKGTQAKYHLLTWPGGSKWQLGTWGALQYAQQHAAESQLYTSLMLLVGAGVHTLVLSGRWKIESCFSLSVSSSNAFCSMKKKKVVFNYISVLSILSSIGIMNAQNFSLQREGRCTIYYTNAKQVVILQSGSLGCYYGPDRQAPLTAWQRAPWTAMKSTRQNKASFPASCRTFTLHSVCPSVLYTHFPWEHHSNGSKAEGGDLTSRTCTSTDASQAESPGVLRREAFQVQTHTGPSRMRRWRSPQWWVLAWPHSYSPFYQYYKACGGGEALI